MSKNVKLYKFQTPFYAHSGEPQVLLYSEGKNDAQEVQGKHAEKIIISLGMDYTSDKVYCEGLLTDKGELILNKDTLTREDQGW